MLSYRIDLDKAQDYPTEEMECPKCKRVLKFPNFDCPHCKIKLVFFVKALV